jgi:hypothetical protein
VHRRRHGHRHVHCTRLNKRQQGALNDEKIICQLRLTLIKTECPVSRRAFLSGNLEPPDIVKDRENPG